jgi:pimeloyl-ACP methyl ester carboxylesterase
VAAPFGPHSDEQWRHLTVHCTRQFPDGSWGFVYDPAIGNVLHGELNDIDFSAVWDAVKCPTLLLRGEHSDILHRDIAQAMTERGPRARLVEIQGVGHAPTLMHASQVDVVRDFLLEKQA